MPSTREGQAIGGKPSLGPNQSASLKRWIFSVPRIPCSIAFSMGCSPDREGSGVGGAVSRMFPLRRPAVGCHPTLPARPLQARQVYATLGRAIIFATATNAVRPSWASEANVRRGGSEDADLAQ